MAGGEGARHGVAVGVDDRSGPAAGGPDAPNALWTIDYKGQFRTGAGQWLYPLTVADARSRYPLAFAGHRQV